MRLPERSARLPKDPTMRYLMILKADQPATEPPAALMDAIMKRGADATAVGALLDTAGLAPSIAGAKVSLTGGGLSVTDGPFAEIGRTTARAVDPDIAAEL